MASINEIKFNIAKYRRTLLKNIKGKILETGVGTSRNLRFYPKNVKLEITGVDYSPNALELALSKKSDLNIKYKLEDVEK